MYIEDIRSVKDSVIFEKEVLIFLKLVERVVHEERQGMWCIEKSWSKALIDDGAWSDYLLKLTVSKT